MDCAKFKLKEISYHITDGEHCSVQNSEDGGFYLLSNKNIIDGNIVFGEDERKISKETFDKINKRTKLSKGDLVISTVGTLGKLSIIKEIPNYDFQRSVGIIKPNCSVVDVEYLYYYMQQSHVQKKLTCGSSGAIQKCIFINQLKDFEVQLPSLSIQHRLASALSSFDKRIENLRAQNRVLEQTAKTIYDYTFLQCAGHQTTYNKTLNRNIPVGWEVKEFQNICNIKRGASPRPIDDYMDPTNQGMPWVKISDASKDGSPFMLDVKESIIKDGVSKSVTVTPGTLIVSNSASPGIPKFIQLTACVHDGWLVLDKYDESFKYYLFYVILDMRENLLHIASGSVFKNLKTDYLKQLPVLIPDSKTMENFNAKIKPLFEKQLVNAKQIESLTTQRNTLLPLLMTGQIEVV